MSRSPATCAARVHSAVSSDVFLGLFRHISSAFLTYFEVSCDVCGASAQRSLFRCISGSLSTYFEFSFDIFRGLLRRVRRTCTAQSLPIISGSLSTYFKVSFDFVRCTCSAARKIAVYDSSKSLVTYF